MSIRHRFASLVLASFLAGAGSIGASQAQEALSAAEVERVQEALNEAGYDAGEPDGLMGPATRAAIVAYQAAEGIEETGEASPALLDRLTGSDGSSDADPDAASAGTQAEPADGEAGGDVANRTDAEANADASPSEDQGEGEGAAQTDQADAQSAQADGEGLPEGVPNVGDLVSATTGNCPTDLSNLQSDLERVASQIQTEAISICEANAANFRILTQGAETLRRCRSNGDSQADEFAASGADAREAVLRNCAE